MIGESYPENVVPDGGATEVDVEVRVALRGTHQAVLGDSGLRDVVPARLVFQQRVVVDRLQFLWGQIL